MGCSPWGGKVLDIWHPAVMVHGHVHQAYTGSHFIRERDWNGIPVINASMAYEFDLPETPNRKEPNWKGLRLMKKASTF